MIVAVSLSALDRRARRGSSARAGSTQAVARLLEAVAPNMVTSILLLIAGLLVVFRLHAGLYVLVIPVLSALLGGVVSAWLLLTRINVHPD